MIKVRQKNKRIIAFILVLVAWLLTQLANAEKPTLDLNTYSNMTLNQHSSPSNIKADENLIFFRTNAWFESESDQWYIPIHGWVYEPQNSTIRKKVFAKALEKKYQLKVNETTEANFSRRINLMLADNERGKKVIIKLAGKYYPLNVSKPNGQIKDTIIVSAKEIDVFLAEQRLVAKDKQKLHKNRIQFTAISNNQHTQRVFAGESLLLRSKGISVISDIDDTIKITEVKDHKKLLNNTFLKAFSVVPSISSKYQEWHDQNVSIHFVSSSPWQLYSPLSEFMAREGFPWATLSLKTVRFKDSSLFDLFKKGTATKPLQIEPILRAYPKRQFILIGDSGEQDPEVYADIYQRFKPQIKQIYIRNVTQESRNNERFSSVFEGIPSAHWSLFKDAEQELPNSLYSVIGTQ